MKDIHVILSRREIIKRISDTFKPSHKQCMSDCLNDILDDTELQTVFKASLNIEPELQYKIGDDILVRADMIYIYEMDKDAMVEAGLIKENTMKATIVNVKPYALNAEYYVEADYIKKGSAEVLRDVDKSVSARYVISLIEDFIED